MEIRNRMNDLALIALFRGVGAAAFCLNIPESQVERNLIDLERHEFFEFLKDLIYKTIQKHGVDKAAEIFKMSKDVLVNLERLKAGMIPTFIYHPYARKKGNPLKAKANTENDSFKRVKVDHSIYPTIFQDSIKSKAAELEKQLKANSAPQPDSSDPGELTIPVFRKKKMPNKDTFRAPSKILPFEKYKKLPKLPKSSKSSQEYEPDIEETSKPASSILVKAFKALNK